MTIPNMYDAIRIISLNLDEIEFVQHHVWIDLKPNQTEHIKYAGAHTLCIQNRAASMLLCSIYTLFYRHPYIRIQHAHSYLHSPVCKASKANKGWRHRISVLTWTFCSVAGALLSCTICNLLTRRAHSLSLSLTLKNAVCLFVCASDIIKLCLLWCSDLNKLSDS